MDKLIMVYFYYSAIKKNKEDIRLPRFTVQWKKENCRTVHNHILKWKMCVFSIIETLCVKVSIMEK